MVGNYQPIIWLENRNYQPIYMKLSQFVLNTSRTRLCEFQNNSYKTVGLITFRIRGSRFGSEHAANSIGRSAHSSIPPVYEIHSPRQALTLTKLFNMIVPILGHFPQPRLQLFEGLNGSFKFIKFCFRLTEKGLTFFIFMIYQDLTKSDHRPVPPDVEKAIKGSDKHVEQLLSLWMPSMYPKCRRHSDNELGAERLIYLFCSLSNREPLIQDAIVPTVL